MWSKLLVKVYGSTSSLLVVISTRDMKPNDPLPSELNTLHDSMYQIHNETDMKGPYITNKPEMITGKLTIFKRHEIDGKLYNVWDSIQDRDYYTSRDSDTMHGRIARDFQGSLWTT